MNEIRRFKGTKFFVVHSTSYGLTNLSCASLSERKIKTLELQYRSVNIPTMDVGQLRIDFREFHGVTVVTHKKIDIKLPKGTTSDNHIDHLINYYAGPVMAGGNINHLMKLWEMEAIL